MHNGSIIHNEGNPTMYTPGTVVQFVRYGTRYTGTVTQAPRGNVLIVRLQGRGSLTWVPVEAVSGNHLRNAAH